MIYLLYGNAAVADFLGYAAGPAWDSNYRAVYHFADGTSVSASDSTGQNSSELINDPAPVAGPIGGGINFSSPTMGMSLSNPPSGDGPQTWEFWFRSPSTGWFFCEGSANLLCNWFNTEYGTTGQVASSAQAVRSPNGVVPSSGWAHYAWVWPGAGGYGNNLFDSSYFVNGADVGEVNSAGGGNADPDEATAFLNSDGSYAGITIQVDEFRISSVARSADWIATEYNNQSAPGTFSSIGSETVGAGTVSPAVTSLSATAGPAGSTVTITGSGFGASQGDSTVSFNGVDAGAAISWSDTSITVVVPNGAVSGSLVVTVNGVPSAAVAFTVTPAPAITEIAPQMGPPGTLVTISGRNFGASQGASTVTFGGVGAGTAWSWSDQSINVYVPGGAATGNVVVNLSGAASNGALFTVVIPPSIANVMPVSGPVGSAVTITGAGSVGRRARAS